MQNAAFAAAGIDAHYEAIHVPREELTTFVGMARAGQLDGFNVTTPLKAAILGYLDLESEQSKEAHAANTVRRNGRVLEGHDTDGLGLIAALADVFDWRPRGANALVLGSGPAGRAIGHALRREGAVSVACWSRNEAAAREVGPPPHRPVDLIVSALPESAIVPDAVLERIDSRTLIFDVNYGKARSPVPPGIGGRRSDGLPLLLHQGALSFEWWTGAPAPLDAMRRAISL